METPVTANHLASTQDRLVWLPMLLVFALAVCFLVHTAIDYDTWWNLAAGRYIVQNGALPGPDPFSYISDKSQRWNDHEWLAQVALYLAYAVGGVNGMTLLQAAVILAGLVILFRIGFERDKWPVSVGAAVLVLVMANERFLERPEMVSLLLVPVYLSILHARRGVWLLPFLHVVWVNCHPGHVLGVGLVVAYAIGQLVAGRGEEESNGQRSTTACPPSKIGTSLLLVALALVVATLVNPYTYEQLIHPFRQMSGKVFLEGIAEWQPMFAYSELPSHALTAYKVFLALTVLSFVANFRRMSVAQLLIFLAMTYLSLKSRRHIGVFAFANMPALVCNVNAILDSRCRNGFLSVAVRRIVAGVLSLALIFLMWFVASNRFYIHERSPKSFGLGLAAQQFPVRAADFVEQQNLTGPLFHNYDIGGYLMWRFYPQRLTFIEGRNFVHSAESYALYRDALVKSEAWAKLMQVHNFAYAVIKHNTSAMDNLLIRLHKDPTWRIVFLDEVAAVFVKRDWVSQMPFLREAAESYDHLGQPVSQKGNRPLFPHREIDAGRVLNLLGQRERAEAFFRAALAQCPNVAEARVDLGGLLMLRGARAEAEREFREALRLNPRLTSARYNLANLFAQGGQLDEAIAHYRRVLKERPTFSSARHNLAIALYNSGKSAEARDELRETLRRDPRYEPARSALQRLNP